MKHWMNLISFMCTCFNFIHFIYSLRSIPYMLLKFACTCIMFYGKTYQVETLYKCCWPEISRVTNLFIRRRGKWTIRSFTRKCWFNTVFQCIRRDHFLRDKNRIKKETATINVKAFKPKYGDFYLHVLDQWSFRCMLSMYRVRGMKWASHDKVQCCFENPWNALIIPRTTLILKSSLCTTALPSA